MYRREAVSMRIEVHIEAFSGHPQGSEVCAMHQVNRPLAAVEHILSYIDIERKKPFQTGLMLFPNHMFFFKSEGLHFLLACIQAKM